MTEIKQLKLEKEIYQEAESEGISFTEKLEKLDPVGNYEGTKLSKLDAFERQLVAHGLKVNSGNVALIEDFYRTTSSSVLFPEFINRNVKIGMQMGKREATVDDVIATTTTIDSNTYKSIALDEDAINADYKRIAEGAEFPKVSIRIKDKEVYLGKIGLKIDSSYEAIRYSKVNMFAIAMQVIGRKMATNMVKEALEILINGDGNSNPAGSVSAATSGTLVYNDLIKLEEEFDIFESDIWIGNKATIFKILTLSQFQEPLIGAEFAKTGKFFSPLGNQLLQNSGIADSLLLGFNKKAGIELIEVAGASLVESDKIVSKQINETVISKIIGFQKIWANSAHYLDFS